MLSVSCFFFHQELSEARARLDKAFRKQKAAEAEAERLRSRLSEAEAEAEAARARCAAAEEEGAKNEAELRELYSTVERFEKQVEGSREWLGEMGINELPPDAAAAVSAGAEVSPAAPTSTGEGAPVAWMVKKRSEARETAAAEGGGGDCGEKAAAEKDAHSEAHPAGDAAAPQPQTPPQSPTPTQPQPPPPPPQPAEVAPPPAPPLEEAMAAPWDFGLGEEASLRALARTENESSVGGDAESEPDPEQRRLPGSRAGGAAHADAPAAHGAQAAAGAGGPREELPRKGKVQSRIAAWPPQGPIADSPTRSSDGVPWPQPPAEQDPAAAAAAGAAAPTTPVSSTPQSPDRSVIHPAAADRSLARNSGGARSESLWTASGGSGRAESLRTASGGSTTSTPRPEREASTFSTFSTRAPVVEVSLKLGQLEADAAAAAAAAATHGGSISSTAGNNSRQHS